MFKIKKNSSSINSIVYMISSLISFVLAFLINVILTNYSVNEEVYGQYKYSTNFILTIPAIFSLGITWSCASLLAKDVDNSRGICTISIVSTAVIGIVVTMGLYALSYISDLLEVSLFQDAKIVYPFVTVFLLQKLVNQIYTGQGQALQLSIYNVAPNLIVVLGLIIYIFVFHSLDYTFSILIYLFSYLIIIIPKLLRIRFDFSNYKTDARILFRDVKANGLKVHLSSVFTTSSTQIIALVCGNIYGYAEYGFYSLAASLATVFQLIGSAVAVVNFKQYANTERIKFKDFIFMFILGGVAYLCMFFLIDIVFFWFYPESYSPTILYLRLLCLSNLIYGFSALFNRFFIVKGLGGKVMKNSFITAVASIVFNIPLIFLFKMKGMAVAAIIVSLVNLGAYIVDYLRYIRNKVTPNDNE